MPDSVTFSFEFIADDNIALATVRGEMKPSDIKRLYMGLIAFSSTKQTTMLLVDFRNTKMNFEAQMVLHLVKEIGCITSGYKIARIYPLSDFKQYIIEEYAVRLDVPIRNFSNEADAIEWLLEQEGL